MNKNKTAPNLSKILAEENKNGKNSSISLKPNKNNDKRRDTVMNINKPKPFIKIDDDNTEFP